MTMENDKITLYHIKFSILLALQIPALILSLLIFVFFWKHHAIRRAPQNQALLILLIVNFIQLAFDLPFSLHFYYLGFVSPNTPTYCTWWTFFSFILYVTGEYLMATISVQRHMIVFNKHLLQARRIRILLYNIPLLFCLIYPLIFYIFAIILYPCDGTQWRPTDNACGYADCYLVYDTVLGTFDWVVNNGLPMVINTLANVTLVIRVVRQKRRHQRRILWRQQRNMTRQLFCVSSLYIVAWTPCLTVGLVQILGYPDFLAQIQTDYFIDLIFVICLFLPWICLGLIPELKRWVIKLYRHLQATNTVGPTDHH